MRSPVLLVGAFCIALVLSLLGFMAPAAVLDDIIRDWRLTNAEAGWLGGALFAGYILSVPVLTAYTDRIDPRRIYLVCAAIGIVGNFGFGFVADGLWSGVAFRVLTGIGLAGTYMPGLKALTDQLAPGRVQQRGASYYTSVFALGSGLSILIAGAAADLLAWHWAFAVAGAGGIAALLIVAVVLPPREPSASRSGRALDFRPVFRNRAVLGYVGSFLGIAWEVFASRIWFVSLFAFLQTRLPAGETGWSPTVWATIVALVGVPTAMALGEICVRYDRRRVLSAMAVVSIVLALAIGAATDGPYWLSLALCVAFGMSSYGRTAATTAGTVSVSDPQWRGAALAVHATVGFSGGIFGPLFVGIALDAAGGAASEGAWLAACIAMAIGPAISVLCLSLGRKFRVS